MKQHTGWWTGSLVLALAVLAARAADLGHVDRFDAAGTSGWSSGVPVNNPGSGGVDGPADGFLRVSTSFAGNHGARNIEPAYQGDWIAAGITELTLWLNDVEADQAFEIHVLLSDGFVASTWQYNEGFVPPNGCWRQFRVDLTDAAKWTQTRGEGTFEQVLRHVDRVTIRHDLAPYFDFPDGIVGELGIDHITLGPVPQLCPAPFADGDADGDVDQADFGLLQACMTDPCRAVSSDCACFDRDRDGTVSPGDLEAFMLCASGPMVPADPACEQP